MLYGNLIFIKKTGGDGSKFPVTEKDIKIGRSEECLIRIYNPQVAPEHCQLIIGDNGQTTLRNLSNLTILNGKPLGQGDVTLCHGDVFKLGERVVRWEYLPTSKYYRQMLSPTGRLVAVVMPQQRSLDDQATPGTSASQVSVLKSTPLGKRTFSERGTAESSSAVKIRKSTGTDLVHKARGDFPKFLAGCPSFKTSMSLLHGAKVKERKSTSGAVSSKTPRVKFGGKSRKSTMPSWKVNIVTPPGRKSAGSRSSLTKSGKKSAKSPKNAVKTPLKGVLESKSSEKVLSSPSKSDLKTPEKISVDSKSSEVLVKSNSKSVQKTSLKSIAESPSSKREANARSTRSFSKSPSPKKSPQKAILSTPKQKSVKLARIVQSETKLNAREGQRSAFPKGSKRMSLTPSKGLIKKLSVANEKAKVKLFEETVAVSESQTNLLKEASSVKEKPTRKSVKRTPEKKSPGKIPKKSPLQKPVKTPAAIKVKTPRKSVILKTPGSLKQKKLSTPRTGTSKGVTEVVAASTPLLIDFDYTPSPKKAQFTPRKSAKGKPLKKTPGKLVKSVGKSKSPASPSRKISIPQNEAMSPVSPSPVDIPVVKSTPASTSPGRKSAVKETPVKKVASSPRGVRRKLSPSSSAERAAKMLKTSSPKKPDKNKKAALLVLGKANRKQLLSQNVKVLLKQKIVKKALKQSTGISQKGESTRKAVPKTKKGLRKTASTKKSAKKKKAVEKSTPPKALRVSAASTVKSPAKDKTQEEISKSKTVVEVNQLTPSNVQMRLSSKGTPLETAVKTPSKQTKKPESPRSIMSTKSFVTTLTGSPSVSFDKAAENYLFNSNRRSKRLSSKNDTGRPDFIELSPTALGLIPKNVTVFKTPKDTKRRSSSLVTPKSIRTTGIIKSASTSKIGGRKSVRFSSKDVSYNSEFHTPNTAEKVEFDFSSYHTPDVTVDMFVSPLTDKSSVTKKEFNESKVTPASLSKSSSTKIRKAVSETKKCARKLLQSPQAKKTLNKVSPSQKSPIKSSRSSTTKSPSPAKLSKASNEDKSPGTDLNLDKSIRQLFPTPKPQKSPKNSLSDLKGVPRLLRTPKGSKSPKNDLTDVKGVKKLFQTPKVQKSPRNDLTNVGGIKKLLQTPKVQKSPKNDLTDVRGVKKLLQTPKIQKSPKNDLRDVRGVKKLLKTPKIPKSPKNDLTDVRGVKKLLKTPKAQKSPKNDLTDVRGVKKLLKTPKAQKSPKNDLTDVRGVKKLLGSPKAQKSPKNDLTDVRGVKKLLGSPKAQRSPKNDLTDVRGVKKLLGSPKAQRSPKNDLTDVAGVKQLLGSPRAQKSPKNDLSDLRGIKKLLSSPTVQKSPKNDLTDVTGVKKLLTTPRVQRSPKNNLLEVSGVGHLFTSLVVQKLSRNSAVDMKMLANSPPPEEGLSKNATDVTGVKQLLISKSPESVLKSKKTVSRKSHVNEYRAIRGRRTIYATPKGPKNDLSDVTGVRELFSRHKPISDYNINLTGVAELFDLPNVGVGSKQKRGGAGKKSAPAAGRKSMPKAAPTPKREVQEEKDEMETATRRGRSRKATEVTDKMAPGSKKAKSAEVKKPAKRKAAEKIKASQPKKSTGVSKRTEKVKKMEVKTKTGAKSSEAKERPKGSRKRRVEFEEIESPPPKVRRGLPTADKSDSGNATEISRKTASRSKTEAVSEKKISVKSVKKVSVKAKDNKTSKTTTKVQSKTAIESGAKQIQKVQNRSQSSSKTNSPESKEKTSPRKTRSGKSAATSKTTQKKVSKPQSKAVGKKPAKTTARRTKSSPVVKRSTRRK